MRVFPKIALVLFLINAGFANASSVLTETELEDYKSQTELIRKEIVSGTINKAEARNQLKLIKSRLTGRRIPPLIFLSAVALIILIGVLLASGSLESINQNL